MARQVGAGRARHRWSRVMAAVVLAGAYGWWAVGLRPFSAGATVAVVSAGVAAAVVGASRRPRPPDVSPRSTARAIPWAVLASVAAAWQLAAYLQEPRHDHPTLSSLANAALGTHVARTAAFVAWLAAAVALARRRDAVPRR